MLYNKATISKELVIKVILYFMRLLPVVCEACGLEVTLSSSSLLSIQVVQGFQTTGPCLPEADSRQWLMYCTSYFRKTSQVEASKVEACSMESYRTSCRSHRMTRWIESVCRGENDPAGFRCWWMRKMASTLSLYWLLGGGKCSMRVVTAMEAEQLAAQRQTYLYGCSAVQHRPPQPATYTSCRAPLVDQDLPPRLFWVALSLTFLCENICMFWNGIVSITKFLSYLYHQPLFAMAMSLGGTQYRAGSIWRQGYSRWKVCHSGSDIAVVIMIQRN